jgi:hypothetical protein
LEAYLVTYAIAVGAVERGVHYMQSYPGNAGIILATACLGVPFIAGAKLLDSVKPATATPQPALAPARRRTEPRRLSRSRPRAGRLARGSMSPRSHRTD